MQDRLWTISPSDLTFSWRECPRCVYYKIVRRVYPPRMPFPSIFTQIDATMKDCFIKKRLESLGGGLPAGIIGPGDVRVQSAPILIPGTGSRVILRGTLDTLASLDDRSFAVLDFKCSAVKPENTAMYSRQLHAYALALENPSTGGTPVAPVSRLALIYFDPRSFRHQPTAASGITAFFGGLLSSVEVPRDDNAFLQFLAGVAKVLEAPQPPPPGARCDICKIRAGAA